MLYEESDKNLFKMLDLSLKRFVVLNGFVFKHKPFPKSTGSLYRFGWFYINGYKYSISGWKFKDGLVTFENEKTGEKIKYEIDTFKLKNGEFKKDTFVERIVKSIRNKLSLWLKDLSDKLQS
jgi:hypothetical protein